MLIVATTKIARMIRFLLNPHYLRIPLAWIGIWLMGTPVIVLLIVAIFGDDKACSFPFDARPKPLPDTLTPFFLVLRCLF